MPRQMLRGPPDKMPCILFLHVEHIVGWSKPCNNNTLIES